MTLAAARAIPNEAWIASLAATSDSSNAASATSKRLTVACAAAQLSSGLRRGEQQKSLNCREAGAKMGTNLLVRDLDSVPKGRPDSRRLEVVADGLPLFHGAQLAMDTTLVSPVGRDGVFYPGKIFHSNSIGSPSILSKFS